MPKTAIYVRSPKNVPITGSINQVARVDVFIWNDPNSIPLTPTYTSSKPIIDTVGLTAYFDISPFCREFISHLSYTEVVAETASPVSEYCYCTIKTYKDNVLEATIEYICFNGYGLYQDGYNFTYNGIHLDSGKYQIKTNENSGGVYYFNDGTSVLEAKYYTLSNVLISTTLLSSTVGYVPYITNALKNTGGCVLKIIKDTVTTLRTYTFDEVCEAKYTPINCDFVNSSGGWQRVIFFKVSKTDIDVMNTEFNLMPSTPLYDTKQAIRRAFNFDGKEKIKVNTGFVPESYNEVMKQLLNSEVILLDNRPVRCSTKSLAMHKSINERNINYELSFEYANPLINDIV